MGAIERNGYQFVPEYSVIGQNGAVHVYHHNQYIEELHFQFEGKFPEIDLIEDLVNSYCSQHNI